MHARKALYVALACALPLAASAQPVPPPGPCNVDMLAYGQGGDGGEGSEGGSLGSIDIITGDPAFITEAVGGVTEIEYDILSQRLIATTGGGASTILWVDPEQGYGVQLAVHQFGALTGLEYVGGVLYGAFIEGGGLPANLVMVDPDTGDITDIGPIGPDQPVSGLAWDAANSVMYGITAFDGELIIIDPSDGSSVLVGPTGFDTVGSIEFDKNGVLWGATAQNSSSPGATFTINVQNGQGTQQGRAPVGISGITSCEAAEPPPRGPMIPIPTMNTWGLLALGGMALFFGGMAIRRRRMWSK